MANQIDGPALPSAHLLDGDGSTHNRIHDEGNKNLDQALTASPPKAWLIQSAFVILSGIVPVVAAIVWLALFKREGGFGAFSGEKIGGQLSQSQAKTVDVVCSAVLGPCLLTALNHVWFGSARVSAVNEHHPGSQAGVPLASLVAVSTSAGGSYDFWNLAVLLRGKSWRLSLLAALTLLSAIAKSAVSNIIAYEAYTKEIGHSSILRSLSDHVMDIRTVISWSSTGLGDPSDFTSTFSTKQRNAVANRISGLLTGLSFEDATSNLENSTYISANSTRDSMDNLPPTVTGLLNVPGFRLTVECMADQPDTLQFPYSASTTLIRANWSNKSIGTFEAWYPGNAEDMVSGVYPIAAFRQGPGYTPSNTEVYLGYLIFDAIDGYISSVYGDMKPGLTKGPGMGLTKGPGMSYWGIRCWLNRQDGFLNYTRMGGQRWSISQSQFSSKAVKVASSLAHWQTNLNYRAPGANIPGIGFALAQSAGQPKCEEYRCPGVTGFCGTQCNNATDFSKLALNYLYASAESERILYEVAASNATRGGPESWYSVNSTAAKECYRITYVPAILVASFVSLFTAAAATAAMAAYGHRTYSARQFRQVDVLRLVVDCLDGLQEANAEKDIAGFPRAELETWAARCRVVYEKDDEGGRTQVKLRQATP